MAAKALVIGVAGMTSSGKSTFSAALEKDFPGMLLVIHTDSYYREVLPKSVSPVTGEAYDDYNCAQALDGERLTRDVRAAALGGEYECVVAEGLCVLYFEELRELLDLKVFVELDSAERMYRRIKRNMDWGLSMEEIAGYYLEIAKFQERRYFAPTKQYADIILNGNFIPGLGRELISAWIREKLRDGRD